MKTSALIVLALAAGAAPAAAQTERVIYHLSWNDNGFGSGNNNGLLELGEGATIIVGVSFEPPVGTEVTYTPPPGTGVGTVAGLGSILFDLVSGDCASNTGQWVQIVRRSGWALGPAGTPQPNGEVLDCSAGQAPPPGATANPLNPITTIWRGVWIPESYATRDIVFQVRPAQSAGAQHSSLLIRYGEDKNGRPLYTSKFVEAPAVTLHFNPSFPSPCDCYANCDQSGVPPVLNVNDFVCFQGRFAAGLPYADCDQSGALNVNDFVCFQQRFAAGCP